MTQRFFVSVFTALLFFFTFGRASAAPAQLQTGRVSMTIRPLGQWRHVSFGSPFTTTPVVFVGATSTDAPSNGMQQARVANVTSEGFDFALEDPTSAGFLHEEGEWSYVAVEPGILTTPEATWWSARLPAVGSTFRTIPGGEVSDRALVLTQIASAHNRNDSADSDSFKSLTTLIRITPGSSIEIALEGREGTEDLDDEEVSILVVSLTGDIDSSDEKSRAADATLIRGSSDSSFGRVLELVKRFSEDGLASEGDDDVDGTLLLRDSDPKANTSTVSKEPGRVPLAKVTTTGPRGRLGQTSALQAFDSLPGTGGTIEVVIDESEAYEKESKPARLRLVRSGSTEPVTVFYSLGGSDSPTESSASPDDYRIHDAAGNELAGSVDFPPGVDEVALTIDPVADTLDEVPEVLTFTLQPDPAYELGVQVSVVSHIRDAENTPANERLFIAYLNSQGSANTFASGVSTLRLSGDNTVATLSLSFSGLTTTEVAVHVHIINPGAAGLEAESLELGQIASHTWTIRPVPPVTMTYQAALDALFAGQYYVNVHSERYPTGEIRGDYRRQDGSVSLTVPPDPPELEPLTGVDLDRDIARFLMQATFGPTPALISELRSMILDPAIGNGDRIKGMEAWLDRQMHPALTPQTSLLEYTKAADAQEYWIYTNNPSASYYKPTYQPSSYNRRRGWWPIAVRGNDQFRQRATFALSEIFVVSEIDNQVAKYHYGAADYYDMLGRDAFGSFRTLLEDVSLHPIMGVYLSHLKNQKQLTNSTGRIVVSPDENFAREIMQLFSIGLVQLHPDGTVKLDAEGLPIPTYDQTGVVNMARVFTGWSFSVYNPAAAPPVSDNTNFNLGYGPQYYQAQWMAPMKMFPAYHDTESKLLFGTLTLPGGQTGEQDLAQALDALASHGNTAPFIVRRLIQRFVTSNPSRGYIYRVSQVWTNSNGDLGKVMKAILLDYEARSLTVLNRVGFGKQKEPIVRYVAMLRALNAGSAMKLSDLLPFGYPAAELAKFAPGSTMYRYPVTSGNLGQSPLRSPSVFNWFLPDYVAGAPTSTAGLVAPEFDVTTENQVIAAINFHASIAFATGGQPITVGSLPNYPSTADDIKADLTPWIAIYTSASPGTTTASIQAAVTKVVDALDAVLCAGKLKSSYETAPTPNTRSTIIDTVVNTGKTSATPATTRVRTALYLMLCSPEYVTQN